MCSTTSDAWPRTTRLCCGARVQLVTTADSGHACVAVVSVNELDPLRSEGLEYYRRLRHVGVRARARVLPGTSHAADCPGKYWSLCPEVADSTTQDILAFIRSLDQQHQQPPPPQPPREMA